MKTSKCNSRIAMILIVLFPVLFLIACTKDKQKRVVARVDSQNIYIDEVVQELSKVDKNGDMTRAEALPILNKIVNEYVIFNEAREAGFTNDLRVKKSLAKIRNLVYYREAVDHFLSKYNFDKNQVTARQAIEYGESQNLLREYGIILNEQELRTAYTMLKRNTALEEADLTALILAEFDGGKIFLNDVSDFESKTGMLSDFREYVISVARKKVFAVYAIKNKMHRRQEVIETIGAEQITYIAEKFELVQFNQFLKAKNRKRVNISQESLAGQIRKLPKYDAYAWQTQRTNWIENLRQKHKIMMSEKGLLTAISMTNRKRG